VEPVQPPPPAATDNYTDEDAWPDLPTPKTEQILDSGALEIIALLDGKHISYDIIIEGNIGFISAKSFDEKELLKAKSFRWSPDTKRWVFKFINEPF
jgi:hypothetical protein